MELNNSVTSKPQIFYCRHMQPGVARYDTETILCDTDAMKDMAPTMEGIPVYVGHQPVNLEMLQVQADGYVASCWYNELDGWLWAKFIAVTDAAKVAISKGESVSNAYRPLEFEGPGTKQNVDYDRKIMKAMFTHLAIVPVPRYEDAMIFTPEQFKAYQAEQKARLDELKNSKGNQKMKLSEIFTMKRQPATADDKLEDMMVELENGKVVSVAEMRNTVIENAKKNEADEKAKKDDEEKMNELIDVGGSKIPLKELVNRYNAMNAKTNSADEDEEKEKAKENGETEEEKAKREADEKANEAEKAKEKAKDEAEKENGKKHFDEMQNAASKAAAGRKPVETIVDRVARGKAQYGSKK